ncbi:uncharacterized protein BT62DRAFT_440811 [Guyanagaster necrorhizus]|uniref:Uncharacterized protein n=1 Tax=Guyanagaster necrorhizus TaxID=856835 RepID=A0A9P7W3U1_9AGAR|nr:uncharacterized protein BT62DRAFT_440811 [Guyanagaster necrorhizus MCA 3950]KAG7451662.1 hypothetical protein BT62DRAFT_440811 [Guyanagaster necrorhizus MCA 3950]
MELSCASYACQDRYHCFDSSNQLIICRRIVLGTRDLIGRQSVKVLSPYHNCCNDAEADRVRAEHPGEIECIHKYRTLGLITLTRGEPFLLPMSRVYVYAPLAIGDMPFELPDIYTQRVLALATPPFHPNYTLDRFMARNLTPPYLSNQVDIVHVSLDQPSVRILSIINCARKGSGNLALDLLWNTLGGDGEVNLDSLMARAQFGQRVDDTTIVILPL